MPSQDHYVDLRYLFQESLDHPKRTKLFKIDIVPRPNDWIALRGSQWWPDQKGYNVASGASDCGLFKQCYCFTEEDLTISYTRVFSPTVVMEITVGGRHNREKWSQTSPVLKQLRPLADTLGGHHRTGHTGSPQNRP